MNLAVLQRIDASIEDVLDSAGHVTLYEFKVESQAWEKKEIEGSLFVVRRKREPFFPIFSDEPPQYKKYGGGY